jgi:thiamine pyrophosphate-dependent acetolactate synthase large subunit-like protein
MRDLVRTYFEHGISRRSFVEKLTAIGFTAAAAQAVVAPLVASETAAGATTVHGTGGDLCVAQAKAAGVEYLFTNPGSFEVGFFDAFIDQPGLHMIMGLHEGIVISMADGYARVSGKPAFVNVHAIAGTAQMGGQLYNASRDGSPLVVTAGLNDNEMFSDESVLAPRPGFDQKDVPRQFTKICWDARKAESIPVMLRRAFKMAATEPGGPVYLAIAHYALEAKDVSGEILPASRFLERAAARPAAASVERAAKWIAEAKNPIVIAGDEVWRSGACGALVDLSENLGLPVFSPARIATYRVFPAMHANSAGEFSMSSPFVKQGADLVIFIGSRDAGGKLLPNAPELPPSARIIRIGMDTASMGRNYPTDLALVGDVREALTDLMAAIGPSQTARQHAAGRADSVRAITAKMRAASDTRMRANLGKTPMHPDELGDAVARNIAPDSIVVSENLTGSYGMFPFGVREGEMMWLSNTGLSLGWGIGAAIGAQLAAPKRPVVCTIGDGSVMYSSSGFWTQARYGIPVLTIVWNNKNYQTVRQAYSSYHGRMESSGHYAGMYLGNPDIDFVKLAQSQGVNGERVEHAGQLAEAIQRGRKITDGGKPYLIDVEIARYGGGAASTWYEPFDFQARRKSGKA